MRQNAFPVTHRSRALWPLVLTAAGLSLSSLAGCIIINDDDDDNTNDNQTVVVSDPTSKPPVQPPSGPMKIDTDATLNATPGEGVGVLVEYASGGEWHIHTTCDTNVSAAVCNFDLTATLKDGLFEVVESDNVEGADTLKVVEASQAVLHAETASDTDGMRILAAPGAILRLDVKLDGQPESRFVYWMSNGVVNEGAPMNPVEFEPSVP